jgi:hypothetical protein
MQRRTGKPKGAARSIRKSLPASCREPATLVSPDHPFEKFEAARRYLKRVEHARTTLSQQNTVNVQV